MLIKAEEGSYINSDYIINLYLREHEEKWKIVARMIDASMLVLQTHIVKETAEREMNRIVTASNIRSMYIQEVDAQLPRPDVY